MLLYGNFVYQLARAGYLARRLVHRPIPLQELQAIHDGRAPRLAVLIPSYKEEDRVLRQTVMSAALVEYPERRVVVLIDDPPTGSAADLQALRRARASVAELHDLFAKPARHLARELWGFLVRKQAMRLDLAAEAARAAALYELVAAWLEERAALWRAEASDAFAHADRLFLDRVLLAPAAAHRATAARLRETPADLAALERDYRRLAALLHVEIGSFERKRFENLSHAPNKAMNLNAYIGLIGKSFREVGDGARPLLEECTAAEATLVVPPAEYLLTLDADSVVLPDYALRLVDVMERDARIAVAQTPYSAFPGATSPLERVAGATTDLQYIVHQGFTAFGATYWVGANALLRFRALQEIRVDVAERGHQVPVFIQDRTVIEDTGSTIDLVRRGWTLFNYPERLAYSATPPDFGSLVIQRQRWANGGLIILPDLVRFCLARSGARARFGEAFMRIYYLVSPAAANLGLLALLFYPFNGVASSVWLLLAAAPYYLLYGRDLAASGYRSRDLVHVYALNLMLMPVNLAGVLSSVRQACTGRKTPFARTPKIEGRTATPPAFIVFNAAAALFGFGTLGFDFAGGRWSHAAFAALNAGLYSYGFLAFIGWREACADLAATIASRWPALATRLEAIAARPSAASSSLSSLSASRIGESVAKQDAAANAPRPASARRARG